MGLYPVAAVLRLDTTHKITHRTQTKHSTQNYKNNRGHILYKINTITIQIQIQLQCKYKYNTNTITIQIQLQYTYNYKYNTNQLQLT
jgi:hypothetical protein